MIQNILNFSKKKKIKGTAFPNGFLINKNFNLKFKLLNKISKYKLYYYLTYFSNENKK